MNSCILYLLIIIYRCLEKKINRWYFEVFVYICHFCWNELIEKIDRPISILDDWTFCCTHCYFMLFHFVHNVSCSNCEPSPPQFAMHSLCYFQFMPTVHGTQRTHGNGSLTVDEAYICHMSSDGFWKCEWRITIEIIYLNVFVLYLFLIRWICIFVRVPFCHVIKPENGILPFRKLHKLMLNTCNFAINDGKF